MDASAGAVSEQDYRMDRKRVVGCHSQIYRKLTTPLSPRPLWVVSSHWPIHDPIFA